MANLQPSLGERSFETERARQLDSVVWAVFFIWIGVGMLAAVPWGWFLVGVGALIGVAQLARWQIGMTIEGFWIACGAVIFAAGLWDLLRLPWPLAPMLLIGLGVALLAKTIVSARRNV
jgi:hypothetical protein